MNRGTYTYWHEVVAGDFAVEIQVSYTASPGMPASPWGDCPDPGSAPEFEIQGAKFLSQYGWADFPLTDVECAAIEDDIAERPEIEAGEPDYDAGADDPDYDDWLDDQRERDIHEAGLGHLVGAH